MKPQVHASIVGFAIYPEGIAEVDMRIRNTIYRYRVPKHILFQAERVIPYAPGRAINLLKRGNLPTPWE